VFGELTPDQVRWLSIVSESEHSGKKMRPMPFSVQSQLRFMGLIETRHGKAVLTRQGMKVLAESRKR